ncbi:hypothetical protein Mapa_002550 [Marchantia paleacea]|nr:hypothetical protein Mapa_002550 [Marchantia paleacea]
MNTMNYSVFEIYRIEGKYKIWSYEVRGTKSLKLLLIAVTRELLRRGAIRENSSKFPSLSLSSDACNALSTCLRRITGNSGELPKVAKEDGGDTVPFDGVCIAWCRGETLKGTAGVA